MNQELGLKILSEVMRWSDDRSHSEFNWLRLIARWQYDGYDDFLAGVRFIESLVAWLQQFDPSGREIAYELVRNHLIYISTSKQQRLIEMLYAQVVEPRLLSMVSTKLNIPKYRVWADSIATKEFDRLRRKTLFMALSEGARIDSLRYANIGRLSNEQVVNATQIDKDKWKDMLKKLREDLDDPKAQFAMIVLIDDFIATGTTFLRYDGEKGQWIGRLIRVVDSICAATSGQDGIELFETNSRICVHHYVGSNKVTNDIKERVAAARAAIINLALFGDIDFSFGLILPADVPINHDPDGNAALIRLTEVYYDPIIRTRHTDVGGFSHLGLGYGNCALPVVLEHNTPNNSIALLWAETEGGRRGDGNIAPAMRPLFRRRQRYPEAT